MNTHFVFNREFMKFIITELESDEDSRKKFF